MKRKLEEEQEDETSSDEDFAWLDKKTFAGEELDEVEKRLLGGII